MRFTHLLFTPNKRLSFNALSDSLRHFGSSSTAATLLDLQLHNTQLHNTSIHCCQLIKAKHQYWQTCGKDHIYRVDMYFSRTGNFQE